MSKTSLKVAVAILKPENNLPKNYWEVIKTFPILDEPVVLVPLESVALAIFLVFLPQCREWGFRVERLRLRTLVL
jgi:hypothetical protein